MLKQFYSSYKGILLLPLVAFLIECSSAHTIEPLSAEKCYEGEIIHGFCPSYVIVNVTNSNIGEKWKFGDKIYSNAVLIKNFQLFDKALNMNDEILSRKVYFQVDIEATAKNDNCQDPGPCLLWADDTSAPERSVCVKFISHQKCDSI